MASAKKRTKKIYGPARTPQARENQLIDMAYNLAQEKLQSGTASSQLITHFLKLATTREELENDRLRSELELTRAKIKRIESQSTGQELYAEALRAFRNYSGSNDEYKEEFDD